MSQQAIQNQPHDVVDPNTCLIMRNKCRKGEDGTTVNQEFDLVGSPLSGPNRVSVSLGGLYREDFLLNKKAPFRTIMRKIRIPSNARVKLEFNRNGGDNQGLLLDNILFHKLTEK